jgi:hypothetical protein
MHRSAIVGDKGDSIVKDKTQLVQVQLTRQVSDAGVICQFRQNTRHIFALASAADEDEMHVRERVQKPVKQFAKPFRHPPTLQSQFSRIGIDDDEGTRQGTNFVSHFLRVIT